MATIPARIRGIVGLEPTWQALRIGEGVTNALRWALGSSPAWHISLVRAGAPVPDGLFRQPLPPEATALLDRA